MSERIVPSGWKDGFISTIASVNPPVSLAGLNADSIVSFLSMADVGENGRVVNLQRRPLSEVRSGFTRFQDDDVLFAKITPCMENGKGALARHLENGIGFGSTEFHVLRANESGHADFIYHLSLFAETRENAVSFFSGSAGQQRVSTDFFSKYPVLVPPKPEQRKIARILTTLDNLIEKTEALIAKYQAIKQGMMHDLFTRGVDASGKLRPTQEQAPDLYKQSELGWIPKDWDAASLNSFASDAAGSFVNGPFGSDLLTSELTDEGVPVIYVRDIKPSRYQRVSTVCVTEQKADQLRVCNVRYGDVLVAKIGDPPCDAAPYLLNERSVITQDVIRIRPAYGTDPIFLSELLNSTIAWNVIGRILIVGTRSRVSLTEFKRILLPKPAPDEQVEIGRRIQALENKVEAEQSFLTKQRLTKSGLMQDLLTGKVRVKVDEAEEVAARA